MLSVTNEWLLTRVIFLFFLILYFYCIDRILCILLKKRDYFILCILVNASTLNIYNIITYINILFKACYYKLI